MIRYRCIYRAKVLGQSSDRQAVSVRPFDASLPDMTDIPLRHGVPGIKVQVAPGCSVQIGWDDGRPDRPFAALWSADASAVKVSLVTDDLRLGSDGATEPAVLGNQWRTLMNTVLTALATHTHLVSGAVAAPSPNLATFTTEVAGLSSKLSTVVKVES
jgi:hypothetical protein